MSDDVQGIRSHSCVRDQELHGHSWLLADPRRFGEVITNVLTAADEVTSAPTPLAMDTAKILGPTCLAPREIV